MLTHSHRIAFLVAAAARSNGLHLWLTETHAAHPRLYSLVCVLLLLAAGGAIGLLSDLVLRAFAKEGEAADG